jgi:hypothetical protein
MPPLPPHFHKFGKAALIAIAASIVLWWAVWSIAASQYRTFVDNWIATHHVAGYDVTYQSRDAEGFPFDISLHFTDFVLQNSDGVRIHANDVSLSTIPWRWHRFNAKLKHGFEIAIPFTGSKTLHIVTDETARDHTELAENGDWKLIDLDLADAKALWGDDPFFSADKFAIALDRPETPPQNSQEPGLTIAGSAANMIMPPGLDQPFGEKIAKIDVALRVMGDVPDPRKKESVAAWSNGAAVVQFDKFVLNWGPLLLSARGTLGLDDDLQPEGAFSADIGNHKEILKTLMAQNYIPKRDAGMLDSAINLFTKKVTVEGATGIQAPIAVQLGGLFLGPVRIFEFSDIKWGDEPPPALDAPGTPAPVPAKP